MPGIRLGSRETCQLRSEENTGFQNSRVTLSPEEEIVAEQSLSVYCKPVELYNILRSRAEGYPLFLQRCLAYNILKKNNERIQMTISISRTLRDGLPVPNLFPMYTLLAKAVSDSPSSEIDIYHITRAHPLTTSSMEGASRAQAKFTIPEISRLAELAETRSYFVLFINHAVTKTSFILGTEKDRVDNSSFSSDVGKFCLWGKMPLEPVISSWKQSPKLEIMSTVDLHDSLVTYSLNEEGQISFHRPYSSGCMSSLQQIEVIISAEELGARERSPYKSSNYSSSPSCPVLRLRAGNVIFNYRYYNDKLHKTEVTEDFSCPFCLVKCGSFWGLKCHLLSCHDLFQFEFWVTEEFQAVNVSVKTSAWRPEIIAEGVDPKQQTFSFCSKPLRRKKRSRSNCSSTFIRQPVVASDVPAVVNEANDRGDEANSSRAEIARSSSANCSESTIQDLECIQSVSKTNFTPPHMLQFDKTRKLSVERSENRSRALLKKREFFHSHRAQPMLLEQVLADHDSEDEVDDDVADLEDRRMLDDFVDVTPDEKKIMHLWNSFVRRQRVLADGHIPWACEAFSRLHGRDLVQQPSLLWCWRIFMIKLWNHALLDGKSINNCNIILEQYSRNQDIGPEGSNQKKSND